MQKFNPGDLVTCPYSEEIIQPMTVVGLNRWYDNSGKLKVYYVKGKHKRGHELTITLEENVLQEYKSVID